MTTSSHTGVRSVVAILFAVVVLVPAAVPASQPPARAQAAFDCADVFVTGARGSGQAYDDQDQEIRQFFAQLRGRVDTDTISYAERELGAGAHDGFQYPAVGLDFVNLLDAEFGLGPIGDYRESVEEGVAEAAAYLNDRADACPEELWVLSGYSQGAQVMGTALYELTDAALAKVAFVALFGDPKLDNGVRRVGLPLGLPGTSVEVPSRCLGFDLSWTRATIRCFEPGGVLEPRDPYLPAPTDVRTGSWCDRRDFICNGNLLYKLDDTHGEYDTAWVPAAAREAAEALRAGRDQLPWQDGFDVTYQSLGNHLGFDGRDWVFVIDTTGSMGSSLAAVKAEASAIAEDMLLDDLWNLTPRRVALVEYRDHGDAFVSRVVVGLTDDLQAFVDGVDGLVANGGGDYPEAVYSGLFTAFDELDWRLNASKVAILIGDAPAKDPEPITGYTEEQMATRAYEVDPVNVFPIAIGEGPVASFQSIADATSGQLLRSSAGNLADTIMDALAAQASSPLALLRPDRYVAEPGTPITFSAADSYDADGELVEYRWDFEADGTVDRATTEPTVTHAYDAQFDGLLAVTVVSSDGGTGNAVAPVFVADDPMDQLAPRPPGEVLAVAGDETGRLEVSWTPSPSDDVGGYRLYRSDGTFLTTVADRTSVSIIEQEPGATVEVLVFAVGEYGLSVPAASAPVVVPGGNGVTVDIDVLPGSDDNPLNLRRRGVVPIALLGSEGLDVAEVDPASLGFGPGAAPPAHDLAGGGHVEDVDGDGVADLVIHVNLSTTGLGPDDTEACVTGMLLDGTPLSGCDTVRVFNG